MSNLYITADQIGTPTGGGAVTFQESEALKSLGPCTVISRAQLEPALISRDDPWCWDATAATACASALADLDRVGVPVSGQGKLAHFYAGTFSRTVEFLKRRGYKVTYTAAAHDVAKSRQAHLDLGIPFDYPHLNDPKLWERYVGGYLAADALVCPSTHSAEVMRGFGYNGRIEVIPHGCHLPDRVAPLPDRFVVGYLGAVGPDKGLWYLLEAWKRLNYQDGAELVIAGSQTDSSFMVHLGQSLGISWERSQGPAGGNGPYQSTDGTNIRLVGGIANVSDFYNYISLLVQPSVTEGFGITVLEAMAHSRMCLCSDGAGASDMTRQAGFTFTAGSVEDICLGIENFRRLPNKEEQSTLVRSVAEKYSWDKIRQRYVDFWRSVLV